MSATYPWLLGDIGATHARFAWVADDGRPLSHVRTFACDDFEGLQDAIQHYLKVEALGQPAKAALGVATPVTSDKVAFTNRAWAFSISALRKRLGAERLFVMNDFEAMAWSLPDLRAKELFQVGGTRPLKGKNLGLVGPGSGLGVAGLTADAGAWHPVSGEGGHVSLVATNALEWEVLQCLQRKFGHVSAERVLSGPGLVNLYDALSEIAGQPPGRHQPQDIGSLAFEGQQPQALQAFQLFAAWLGAVASDVALTLGAQGGVYIGGGIVPRYRHWLATSSFRSRFENKGRFSAYLRDIPVYVIQANTPPALRGARRALMKDL